MATHGTVKPFNEQSDDWPTYIERLIHYFIANDVQEEAKKRSILLTVCGATTYKLIRSLAPDGLDSMSYADMVKLVKDYYNPKPSPIVRFHFNSRSRAQGESIASYVAALRDLALHCDYGDRLSEMLRDRLVHGVNHKSIQRRLLAEPHDLTFDKAFSLAQVLEAPERNAKVLDKNAAAVQDTPSSLTVNQTRSSSSTQATDSRKRPADTAKRPIACYRCGGPHLATQCRHIQTECRSCKKRGHLARVCRSAKSTPNKTTNYITNTDSTAEAVVGEATSGSDSDSESYDMFTLSSDGTSPFRVDVLLNGVPVQMELDTGASLTIINETTYNQVQQQSSVPQLQPTQHVLKSYSGHSIQLLGHLDITVRYGGTQVNLPVHVVGGGGPNLMGRDWLSHFDVDLKGLQSIISVTTDQQLSELLEKYSSVFTADLACVSDSTVALSVNENARPRFYKPRPIPHTLKEKVELELESLRGASGNGGNGKRERKAGTESGNGKLKRKRKWSSIVLSTHCALLMWYIQYLPAILFCSDD